MMYTLFNGPLERLARKVFWPGWSVCLLMVACVSAGAAQQRTGISDDDVAELAGRAMAEFRRASHDLRSSLEQEVATEELRETREQLREVGDDLSRTVRQANPATIARETLQSQPAAETAGPSDSDDGTSEKP